MRRLVIGSILLGWIAFLAGIVVRGIGAGEHGLLQEMQFILMESPAISMSLETARAVLTGIVVLTLTVALWALMFAVATDRTERRERFMALGAAFCLVMAVSVVALVTAILASAPQAVAMLFAIQMATLMSMLAVGGVELGWDVAMQTSTDAAEKVEAGLQTARPVRPAKRRLTLIGAAANDQGA